MKGFDIMFSYIELKDWNQLDKYFYLGEYRVFKTPNNLYFMIMKDKADKYGNPTYRLYMDYNLSSLCKDKKKIGRYNKDKEYYKFQSYNIGYTLSNYFSKTNIDLKVSLYEF